MVLKFQNLNQLNPCTRVLKQKEETERMQKLTTETFYKIRQTIDKKKCEPA